MKKRILSAFLSVVMLLTLLPTVALADGITAKTYAQLVEQLASEDANLSSIVLQPDTDFDWPTTGNVTLDLEKSVCLQGNWTIPDNVTVTCKNDFYAIAQESSVSTVTVAGTLVNESNTNIYNTNITVQDGGRLTTNLCGDASVVTVQNGGTLTTPTASDTLTIKDSASLTVNEEATVTASQMGLSGTLTGVNNPTLSCGINVTGEAAATLSGTMTLTNWVSVGTEYDTANTPTLTLPADSTLHYRPTQYKTISVTNGKLIVNGTLDVSGTETSRTGGIGFGTNGSMTLGSSATVTMHYPYEITCQNSSVAPSNPYITGTGTVVYACDDEIVERYCLFARDISGHDWTFDIAKSVLVPNYLDSNVALTITGQGTAAASSLYVGNTALMTNGTGTGNTVTGASYDADTNTLTLNGVNITEYYTIPNKTDMFGEQAQVRAGIYYSGSETLNIVLVGNSNKITLHPSYDATTNGYTHAVGIYAVGDVTVNTTATTGVGAYLTFDGATLTAADTHIDEKASVCAVKAESIYVLGKLVLMNNVKISEDCKKFTVPDGTTATNIADATVFVRDNLETRMSRSWGATLDCQSLQVDASLFIGEKGAVTADTCTVEKLELYEGTATFTHFTVNGEAVLYGGTLTVNDMTANRAIVSGDTAKLIVKDSERDEAVKGVLKVAERATFSAGTVTITSSGNAGIVSTSTSSLPLLAQSNCTISGTANVTIQQTGASSSGIRIGGALSIEDTATVTASTNSSYGSAFSAYGGVTISGSPVVDLTGYRSGIASGSSMGSVGDVTISGGTVTMTCGNTGFDIARGDLTVSGGNTTVNAPNPLRFYNIAEGDSGALTVSDGVLKLIGTNAAVQWSDNSGTATNQTAVPTPTISVTTTPASLKLLSTLVGEAGNTVLIGAYTDSSTTALTVDESMNITNALTSITFGVNPCTTHTIVIDPAVAATCTETGLTEGSHCSVCDTVITAQTVIPALGHTAVTDPAVAATCTEPGLSEGSHCSVCDTVLIAQSVIPALRHSYNYTASGTVITETCNNGCGHSASATVSVPGSHTYNGVAQTPATVATTTGWAGTLTSDYTNNTNAGTATASITCGGETASVDFTIGVADYTASPSVSSGTITVGASAGPDLTVTATGVNSETVSGKLAKWYSDSACTKQISNFSTYAVGSHTIYWEFTTDSANYVSTPKTGSYTLTVAEGAAQELGWSDSVKDGGSVNATYGSALNAPTATNSTTGGSTPTYTSSNSAVATVDTAGAVEIVGAGETTITATSAAVAGTYRKTSITYVLSVAAKAPAVGDFDIILGTPTFDGTPKEAAIAAKTGVVGMGDVTVKYNGSPTAPINAGSYTVTFDAAAGDNYKAATGLPGGTLTINKATARTLADAAVSQKYTVTSQQSKSLAGLMPNDAGTLTYAKGTATGSVTSWDVDSTGNVTFTLNGAAGGTVTLPVTISSTNYADSTVRVVITLTDKDVPTVNANAITVTYTGNAVADSSITGTATFNSTSVAGTWSWKATAPAQGRTTVADSGTKTVVFTPNDTNTFATVEATLTLTINKATPTGAPSYTSISEANKTLADAALTAEGGTFSPTGSVKWVDASGNDLPDTTVVTANTAYRWLFTPADTDNYSTLSGSVTLYSVYSGGGGGSASTPTTTTPEVSTGSGSATATVDVTGKTSGSTTTATVTQSTITGAITAAVEAAGTGTAAVEIKVDTPANADSLKISLPSAAMDLVADSKAETLTITSGVGEITISSEAASSIAQQAGTADVTVTISKVDTEKTLNERQQAAIGDAPVYDLSVTANGKYISEFDGGLMTVTLPYTLKSGEDPAGVVVWYMDENGNIEKLRAMYDVKTKTVVFTTNHFSLYVVGYDEIAAMANPFADVADSAYYYDAVKWAAYMGVTSGTSATTFSPNATCTRAQAVTFLWRASGSPEPTSTVNPFTDVSADAYYYKAVLWAVEQGITVGTSATTFSPNATCSRGQIVTFQYRAAGSPAVETSNPFTDVDSDAYYAAAVNWAVAEGITSGSSATTFSPASDCTRAQIVTFLYRYLGK